MSASAAAATTSQQHSTRNTQHATSKSLLSKVRISGFGSNACCKAAPDRRFAGIAVSANESTKSRTVKSLLEKSSSVKLGPLGKRLRDATDPARSIASSCRGCAQRSSPIGLGVEFREDWSGSRLFAAPSHCRAVPAEVIDSLVDSGGWLVCVVIITSTTRV